MLFSLYHIHPVVFHISTLIQLKLKRNHITTNLFLLNKNMLKLIRVFIVLIVAVKLEPASSQKGKSQSGRNFCTRYTSKIRIILEKEHRIFYYCLQRHLPNPCVTLITAKNCTKIVGKTRIFAVMAYFVNQDHLVSDQSVPN